MIMKILLLVIFLVYSSMCAALFFLQRKILYYPQPAMDLPADISRVEFAGNGVVLRGWVLNEKQAKAVLYYGGNAEQIEQHVEFFRTALPDYTVYLVPYRGYGNSTGSPAEQDLYRDAQLVYDSVSKNHTAVAVIGRSLGSGVATYLATTRPIEKLVLITPYDSIENVAKEKYWMFPMGLIVRDKYLSWRRAGDIKVDTLVLLAGNDTIIPRQRSENLIEHLPSQRVSVVDIPEAMHNDISTFPKYREAIRAHLN